MTCDELKKNWEEKSAAYVREVEEAEEPSPSYKRYWRRRAEEAREEEFYKQVSVTVLSTLESLNTHAISAV